MIVDLFSILGFIINALIGFAIWQLQRRQTRREKIEEERDAARARNEALIVKSVGASIALGEAAAIALKNGKCNGETEAALAYARQIKHEQKDFLTEQGIKNLY